MKAKQIEQKTPWKWYVLGFLAALAILFLTTLFPIWQWFPVQVTETVTVLAVTEFGCVTDAVSMNYPVVLSECTAEVGETTEVTFYRPAIEQGDYYEKLQQKAELVNP